MGARERDDCRVSIVYSTPRMGASYFTPQCTCGWFGTAHARQRTAQREALTHTTLILPTEAEGPPAGGPGRSVRLLHRTRRTDSPDEATAG